MQYPTGMNQIIAEMKSEAGKHGGFEVLFTGANVLEKTAAVAKIAHSLELDLYRIDLGTTVSKYIGETEKNLRRVFDDAPQANAILFLDEADALFGKRTEVKDSHDRFANLETTYLLQRLEEFPGLAILVTNQHHCFDDAFLAHFRHVVDF